MFYEFDFFQPIDFLKLSEEMYSEVDSFNSMPSAVKRTVISRIYYSTFLYVRDWLIRHGYSSTKNDHTQIPDYIGTQGPFSPVDNQYIATELLRLKKLRHQADYYITRNDCLRYGSNGFPMILKQLFKQQMTSSKNFKIKSNTNSLILSKILILMSFYIWVIF